MNRQNFMSKKEIKSKQPAAALAASTHKVRLLTALLSLFLLSCSSNTLPGLQEAPSRTFDEGINQGQDHSSTLIQDQDLKSVDKLLTQTLAESFQATAQAGLDRLEQDATQAYCSELSLSSTRPGLNVQEDSKVQELLALNASLITKPTDENYFGDFVRGEQIAQDGRGSTWSDPIGAPNGGNCYNCHRLSPNEISYGTLGPSLYRYGKNRGIQSMNDFEATVKRGERDSLLSYTWGVLVNAKAYNLCTVMPRFGAVVHGQGFERRGPILNQQQLKDLMSLLLDPRSPVNQ
jgi:L-cysteine S-thiosulfotransferase